MDKGLSLNGRDSRSFGVVVHIPLNPAADSEESGRRGTHVPRPPMPPYVLIVYGGFLRSWSDSNCCVSLTDPWALNHATFIPSFTAGCCETFHQRRH